MPTRVHPVEEENWTDTARSVGSRRGAEVARRIAAKNVEDSEEEVLPVRNAGLISVDQEENQTQTAEAAILPPVRSKSGPAIQEKTTAFLNDGIPRTYKISLVCNKALELASKDRACSKSELLHAALESEIDDRFFRQARIYQEIQDRIKKGTPIEQLEGLRKELGTITKKTQQRNQLEGVAERVCLVTANEDHQMLDFYCRETGFSRGFAVDQALRAYLSDYIPRAKDLISLFDFE